MRFVRTKLYLKSVKQIGWTAVELGLLEEAIATSPFSGALVPGLGGIRKMRFGFGNKGKSGGGRVIYYLEINEDMAIMLFAYAKNVQEDMSTQQRKAILRLLKGVLDD